MTVWLGPFQTPLSLPSKLRPGESAGSRPGKEQPGYISLVPSRRREAGTDGKELLGTTNLQRVGEDEEGSRQAAIQKRRAWGRQ